jgi:hypothetical protein
MICDICRETAAAGSRVCAGCARLRLVVRTPATERFAEGRTFYVASLTGGTDEYTVKRAHGRMTCTCPDYVHRGQVVGAPCKHVRVVQLLARAAGGVDQIRRGVTLTFRVGGRAQQTAAEVAR